MNLLKNVDGDWHGDARQYVRQDLDTIQRTINALIAQVNAIKTPTPVPPAVLSSANSVTTFGAEFLRSVATKPGGGLVGNGTVTNPLGLGQSSALVSSTFVITIAQMQTLHSIPISLVSGVAGKTILPVSIGFHTAQITQFSVDVSGKIRWAGFATDISGTMNLVYGGLTPGVQVDGWAFATMPDAAVGNARSFAPGTPIQGVDLVVLGSVDSGIGPIQPGRTQITGAVAYYLV